MRKQVWLRAAAGLTAAALVLTACSQKSNEGGDSGTASKAWPETALPTIKDGRQGGTFRFAISEPTAIDPYNAQESEGLLVTRYLFTGLTQVDPEGEVIPGVADKWESNDDCTQWTFDLKTGILTMLGSLVVGVTLGALAGFRGRFADGLIMRTTDIFLSFPFLIGAILVVRTFGSGVPQVIIALVVLGWPTAARLMRGQMLALREAEYVEAARSIGASDWRIVIRHILPNAIQPVFIYSFTSIGIAVVSMASLAYLGVGVPPDTPEWGRLINQGIEQVQVPARTSCGSTPAPRSA